MAVTARVVPRSGAAINTISGHLYDKINRLCCQSSLPVSLPVCVARAVACLFATVQPVPVFGALDDGDEEIDVPELDVVGLRLLGNEIRGRHDSAQKILHMLNGCFANAVDHASMQYGDIVDARVCLNTPPGLMTAWVIAINLEQILPHSACGVLLLHEHLVLLHLTILARIDHKEPQTKRCASGRHRALLGGLASGIITTASRPVH